MEISDDMASLKDAVFSYDEATLIIIGILYILLILMEFLIDLKDID